MLVSGEWLGGIKTAWGVVVAAAVAGSLLAFAAFGVGSASAAYVWADKWDSSGSEAGRLTVPSGIDIGSGGVYVVDTNNDRVQRFSPQGVFQSTWGSYGTGLGEFDFPFGVAIDTAGSVHIADTTNGRVQKFNAVGTITAYWGSAGSGATNFNSPTGIAVDDLGNVFVADTDNHRIQVLNGGLFQGNFGGNGSEDGKLNLPRGVAIDGDGNVLVADYGNDRIQKFSVAGVFLGKWGGSGTENGKFNRPTGIAVEDDGSVFVVDSLNNRVQKFSPDGEFLTKWGTAGTGNGKFASPRDVAVGSAGRIYVTDSDNNRVQVFGEVDLRLKAKSAPRKLKAGKSKVALKLTVRNRGRIAAKKVKACVKVPKKKLKVNGKKCRTLASVSTSGSTKKKIFLKAKPALRGKRSKVTVTVSLPGHRKVTKKVVVAQRR